MKMTERMSGRFSTRRAARDPERVHRLRDGCCRDDDIAAGKRQQQRAKLVMSLLAAGAGRRRAPREVMQSTSRFLVRDPDGVPHEIVGLTWVFAFAVASFSFAALTSGGVASAIALLLFPAAIIAVVRRADRTRDARRRR
jgi:hypothetical protein